MKRKEIKVTSVEKIGSFVQNDKVPDYLIIQVPNKHDNFRYADVRFINDVDVYLGVLEGGEKFYMFKLRFRDEGFISISYGLNININLMDPDGLRANRFKSEDGMDMEIYYLPYLLMAESILIDGKRKKLTEIQITRYKKGS